MISNVFDPATPMAGGVQLREQIGKSRANFYPRTQPGHTVYFQPGVAPGKALKAMNKYFIDLELPEEGTVFEN